MKEVIKRIPIAGSIAQSIYRKWINPPKPFVSSESYWIERYNSGGASGPGSCSKLAKFKAEILNEFVENNNIKTIIEYGCGDGNQLRLTKYPSYIGFDVSLTAISLCKEIFSADRTKTFRLMKEYKGEIAQLTLSLDVIYHLIEDDTFEEYMWRLFDSAEIYVVIYSSNTDVNADGQAAHIRHRKFTRWIENNKPDWVLFQHIPNSYPFTDDGKMGSFADFYIYKKA
jgi:hypothetical protein